VVVLSVVLTLGLGIPNAGFIAGIGPDRTLASPLDSPPAAPDNSIVLQPFLSGFGRPIFMTHAGDGTDRLWVVEKTGRIKLVVNGAVRPTPFLDLVDTVIAPPETEQGLLGLAFHPQYETNGRFFVWYTAKPSDGSVGNNTLAEYRVMTNNPERADPSSQRILLSIPDNATNHNAGTIAFGPDGKLYIATGDGGAGQSANAQDLSSLFGKMLRIDVDTPPGPDTTPDPPGSGYSLPTDNPFFDQNGVREEIWLLGFRNPYRWSFDRQTGDMFIGDVGEVSWEEVDFVPAGAMGLNMGWAIREGMHCKPPATTCQTTGLTDPIIEYDRATNGAFCAAINGGYRYRGSGQPALAGIYFYADYCSGKIWKGMFQGNPPGWTSVEALNTTHNINALAEDRFGELYVLTEAGAIFRLASTGSPSGQPMPLGPSGLSTDATPSYTWSVVPDATEYELVVRGRTGIAVSRTDPAASVCSGAMCSVTPPTPLAGGTYGWIVRGKNASGAGPWSATKYFLQGSAAPGRATLAGPSGTIADSTPTYTWGAVANAALYRLVVVNGSGDVVLDKWSPDLTACNATGCGVTQPTPLPAGGYFWAVLTWNPAGFGPWSAPGSFTVSAAAAPSRAGSASAEPVHELDPALVPPTDGPPPSLAPRGRAQGPSPSGSPTPTPERR
jgi:glucose/arabinose dehydrogenase